MKDALASRVDKQLLSAEEQEVFTEVMRWASGRQVGPAHTAELLVRVARAIQLAILHLDQASAICAKHRVNLPT
jgi:hypothetical protein